MIEINPAPGLAQEFRLSSRGPTRKGVRSEVQSLASKVTLTQPVVLQLDTALIGEDKLLLAEYQQLTKTHRYYFVSLTCSFAPSVDERFEDAEVTIELEEEEPLAPPVVHSMRPDRLTDTMSVKTAAKIGANFSLVSEVGAEREIVKNELFLYTVLADVKAHWCFRRTKASKIEGSYPLQFVVRAPNDYAKISGELRLSVSVDSKRYLIFWSEEKFQDPASVRFSSESTHA